MHIKCAGQVLDPTLLLNNKEWSQFITKDILGKICVDLSNPQQSYT